MIPDSDSEAVVNSEVDSLVVTAARCVTDSWQTGLLDLPDSWQHQVQN